ncbi:maternal protein exuperantia-like [Ctenocephalides felis]|uniref:maternal protein exuperantia-like n=1 Tax=Ctenocephalides felis TaxID=7515 RepID=UPI000E6E598F|nr:maternal protein exuperantia-like [Ctenocephalides felis]XP_026470752.1 maternal protein exuperantia-like [Ctenocephalides felis]
MVKKPESEKSTEGKKLKHECLPAGKYCLISCDMDTTGRRLIDEICHIAAFTPTSQFSQYIMPYANVNPSARRRHNIRVTSDDRFRVLRSNINNKVIKTKSEICGLTDFLNYLEEVKSKADGAGVILIFHEPKKMVSYMLLEALHRYHLLGKFQEIVKGFANGHALAEKKCSTTMKSFNLKVLSRVLLDREEQFDNASNRAKIIWEIAQHLGQGEQKNLAAATGDPNRVMLDTLVEVFRQYSYPTSVELDELKELRKVAERSSSFQPIFSAAGKMNYRDIQHINVLRSILAEGKSDYNTMKSTYETEGKQGLIKELAKLQITRKDLQHDLLEILDSHFDPKRTATFPNITPKTTKNRKLIKIVSSDDSGAVSLDTTRTTSPLKNAADKTVKTN